MPFSLAQLLLPGYAAQCAGTIQGKEGGIQVLAGLAPSSQTVRSNFRVNHEQAKCTSCKKEVNISFVTWHQSSLSLSLILSHSHYLSLSLSLSFSHSLSLTPPSLSLSLSPTSRKCRFAAL
jgi:hypothetical protein